MSTFRTIGIVGVAVSLLLSGTIAFAEGRVPGALREKQDGPRGPMLASTTERQSGEETRARLQDVRDSAKARIEKEHQKEAQHLSGIKDKVKQEMAQRLADQFDNLNTKWTDHFINELDTYGTILQKIQDRAAIAASAGKDISSTTAAILAAQTAIATARAAVIAQAAKTYAIPTSTLPTPTVASSTPSGQEQLMKGLRKSFQTLHKTLFDDLKALRDGVMKDAYKAVKDALQSLEKVPRVDDENATSTGQTNQ